MSTKKKYINNLIKESSPYLLQHAHNPVNWEAWNPEVLQRAKEQQKLILISIGYAACHWCHVMEHECFEDEDVAETMNTNFINIKVDREERPDIDHIYMDALQMMTGSGGWPLNILALPDGRPFWGATFVKKREWIQVLNQLQQLYIDDPKKIIGYANNMAQGLKEINAIVSEKNDSSISIEDLKHIVENWSTYFDTFLGGYKRAPKFMMPVNYNFLLDFGYSLKDSNVEEYVQTTLTRMAWGGIFDHVGGGFSRYSVDTKWHVPHFEKMLYDNGLLISLYSKAYAATKNKLYKKVVQQSISFIREELLDSNHGFYSSLDADSLTEKGTLEEGAFYVWKESQLRQILKEDYPLFRNFFNINSYGFWEEEKYVLIRDGEISEIAKNNGISEEYLEERILKSLQVLKKEREKRNKPRLDDKILTSWNGLALKGLTDAYRYLGKEEYKNVAIKNANFILSNLSNSQGGLYHNHKNGKSSIQGFLEDYASVIEGLLGLYEVTFDKKWLDQSVSLTKYVLDNFTDTSTGLFFFTCNKDKEALIRQTIEVADNVIPSSNSIMAHNLFKLSKYYPEQHYTIRLQQIMQTMNKTIIESPQNHANWLHLLLLMKQKFYEVAIIGENFESIGEKLIQTYMPNVIFAASKEKDNGLLILKNRFIKNKTLIYVCEDGSCQLPVENQLDALSIIKTNI